MSARPTVGPLRGSTLAISLASALALAATALPAAAAPLPSSPGSDSAPSTTASAAPTANAVGAASLEDDEDIFGPGPSTPSQGATTPGASDDPSPQATPRVPPPEITPPEPGLSPVDTAETKVWLGDFSSGLGASIARGSCDVTGDGRPDIIASSLTRSEWRFDPYYVDTPNNGWVSNVTGRLDIIPADTPGSALPAEGVISVIGPRQTQEEGVDAAIGLSVACLGDTNGDGVDDLAVGSHTMGRAWILYGGPALSEVDLEALSPEQGTTVVLPVEGLPAAHLSAAGDLNGDGLADLGLVLSNVEAATGNRGHVRGLAYVIAGSRESSQVDLGDPWSESPRVLARAVTPEGNLATAFDAVGDVNGDGATDFVLSDYTHADATNVVSGRAWILTGVRPGARIDLAGAFDGTVLTAAPGASHRLGAGASVARAGDADGDGFGDFVIGFDGGNAVNVGTGGVALVRGGRDLPASLTIDPAASNQERVSVITGVGSGDKAGYAVDTLVRPGRPALVAVGAYGAAGGTGRAYVFPVSSFGAQTRAITEAEGLRTMESAGPRARFGRSVAFVGTLLGAETLAIGGDGIVHDDATGEEGAAHTAHIMALRAAEAGPTPTDVPTDGASEQATAPPTARPSGGPAPSTAPGAHPAPQASTAPESSAGAGTTSATSTTGRTQLPVVTPGDPQGSLASTGVNGGLIAALIAGGLLAGGAVVLMRARRSA